MITSLLCRQVDISQGMPTCWPACNAPVEHRRAGSSVDLCFMDAQLQMYHLADFGQACVDEVWIGDIVCNLLLPRKVLWVCVCIVVTLQNCHQSEFGWHLIQILQGNAQLCRSPCCVWILIWQPFSVPPAYLIASSTMSLSWSGLVPARYCTCRGSANMS